MARTLGIDWGRIDELLAKGWTPREIALRLGCSTQNVYARIAQRKQGSDETPAQTRASSKAAGEVAASTIAR